MSQPIDRRVQPRTAANARGVVIADGIELACTIADTSSGGLRIRLDRNLALPARVTVIEIASAVVHEAEVAWRQGMEAGLKLRARATVRGLVPARLAGARDAWVRAGGR